MITTDTDEIKNKVLHIIQNNKFMKNEYHKIVIIMTYQSSDKVIDALNQIKVVPDLCIFDEAHNVV